MPLPSLPSRIIAIAAISLGAVCAATGSAGADLLPATPYSTQGGQTIADNLTCRIHYRQWVETDPARPGRLFAMVQPLGIDPALAGSSESDSCGQWLDLNWSTVSLDSPQFELPRIGQRSIYLRAGHIPGEPLVAEFDVSYIPAGQRVQATLSTQAPFVYSIAGWSGSAPTIATYTTSA